MATPETEAGEAGPLGALEERLGYRFRDRGLLETAISHSSYANEHAGVESNERLEFLGDSALGLAVAHQLYEANPGWSEGDLSVALQRLVDRRALCAQARRLELGAELRLGRTERQSRGFEKDSILADAMEAVLGAMLLDGGFEVVMDFVRRAFADSLRAGAPRAEQDAKTRFQELVMAETGEFPSYVLDRDSGLEGDEERFTASAVVGGEVWGRGVGRTKRAAERAAAEQALALRFAEGEASDG